MQKNTSGYFFGILIMIAGMFEGFMVCHANGDSDPFRTAAGRHYLESISESGESDDPPSGSIVSYPEWYPASGAIISWHWFDDYLTELTRGFVQAGTCWIAVDSYSQQLSVTSMLIGGGVSLDSVDFMIIDTDTVWCVDYGPFFVSVDGDRKIIDHQYGWPEDDLFPQRLGSSWGIDWYTSPLTTEGGNFFADGEGVCFITRQVFYQNPGMTEEEIRAIYEDYCGCSVLHILEPLADYTGHIDMFARLIDRETMVIGRYEAGDPEYEILEANATYVKNQVSSSGEPYKVIRIPMPGEPSAYFTYTNSLQVNNHVFVPLYNEPEDSEAMQIYSDAQPDCIIVGIDSSEPIAWGGAIHCTSKVVPDPSWIPTFTATPTMTPTASPAATSTEHASPFPTSTPSLTPPMPATSSPTPSPTMIPSESPAVTSTATLTPSVTPTQSATSTQIASPSPGVTPTSSSLPTSTSSPTSSPIATSTDIPTISPSPTMTSTACLFTGCRIEIPKDIYHAGDLFFCSINVCNSDQEKFSNYPLFVILDIHGTYFFAPSFGTYDFYTREYPPGTSIVSVIEPFAWPESAGSFDDALFYAALTDTDITSLIGEMDSVKFGWQ